jgi:hypothetical protein
MTALHKCECRSGDPGHDLCGDDDVEPLGAASKAESAVRLSWNETGSNRAAIGPRRSLRAPVPRRRQAVHASHDLEPARPPPLLRPA